MRFRFSRRCGIRRHSVPSRRRTTMTLVSRGALTLLLACMSCLAQSGKTDEGVNKPGAKLEKMPQSLEVRFALSALPPHLRDGATTYVLDPDNGYILDRKG